MQARTNHARRRPHRIADDPHALEYAVAPTGSQTIRTLWSMLGRKVRLQGAGPLAEFHVISLKLQRRADGSAHVAFAYLYLDMVPPAVPRVGRADCSTAECCDWLLALDATSEGGPQPPRKAGVELNPEETEACERFEKHGEIYFAATRLPGGVIEMTYGNPVSS